MMPCSAIVWARCWSSRMTKWSPPSPTCASAARARRRWCARRPPHPAWRDRPPRPDEEATNPASADGCSSWSRPGRLCRHPRCCSGRRSARYPGHRFPAHRAASEDGLLAPSAVLVTFDGVVLDGHGTLSGGAAKGRLCPVLAYKRELREPSPPRCKRSKSGSKSRTSSSPSAAKEQQHPAQQLASFRASVTRARDADARSTRIRWKARGAVPPEPPFGGAHLRAR